MPRVITFLWISLAFFLGACTGTNQSIPPTVEILPTATATSALTITRQVEPLRPTAPPPQPAQLRIIHAAPNAPTLTVLAGFNTIASNLNTGQSTDPTPIEAGDYSLKVLPSGSNPNDTPLTRAELKLQGGETLLIILTEQSGALQIMVMPETQIALNAGESALTVVNAYNQPIHAMIADARVINDTQPGTSSDTSSIPSGDQTLSIYSGSSELTEVSLTFEERKQNVLIVGGSADEIVAFSFQKSAPGRSTVRIINTSQVTQSFDVYLDDRILEKDIPFGRPTARQEVFSGNHTISVFESGDVPDSASPLLIQNINLDATSMALIILGDISSLQVVSFIEDLNPTESGNARIAFMNTLPTFGSIVLESGSSGIPGINTLFYGDPPRTTSLSASQYSFTFIGGDQTVEAVENIILEPGRSYLYLITGRLDNNPLVLSDNVGQQDGGSLSEGDDQAAAQVRFINALAGVPIEFNFGTDVEPIVVDGLSGSPFITIRQRNLSLSATQDGAVIATTDTTFESDSRYSIFLYQTANQTEFIITQDSESLYSDNDPHIRFINLSGGDEQSLGLAFSSNSTTTLAPTSQGTLSPSDTFTLPFGTQQILTEQRGGSISNSILMPTGTFSFYFTLAGSAEYRHRVGPIELGAGSAADLITTAESAFFVVYPQGSD